MIIFETAFYITQGFETRDMIPLLRSNALSGMTPFQKKFTAFLFFWNETDASNKSSNNHPLGQMKLMHLCEEDDYWECE
jgi:hypothetical protein